MVKSPWTRQNIQLEIFDFWLNSASLLCFVFLGGREQFRSCHTVSLPGSLEYFIRTKQKKKKEKTLGISRLSAHFYRELHHNDIFIPGDMA